LKNNITNIRRKLFIIVYGTNTFAGRLFDFILLGLILFSVMLVMLETVADIDQIYHKQLWICEWVITIFFTLEYLLRIIVIDKPKKYVLSFYGIIDLLAVLPMYLSLFFVGTSVLAMVRSFRLLRLFKILNHPKFSHQSHLLMKSMQNSRGKILIFIYFILISTIIIGSIMYVVEGPEAGFTSIPESIYWTIVTLTTVGFGDITPITPLGQFIASVVMILGYGVIAVPTGIVTAEIAMNNAHQNDETEKKCRICDNNLLNDAKYCHQCGTEVKD
jgi:voltage-gated potassium channel